MHLVRAMFACCATHRRLVVAAAQQQGSLLVKGPPVGYDHRVLQARSADLVRRKHPELLPLVQQGTLVALERPADYQERRTDGYQEPQLIFLVGTAHVSPQSAADVRHVVQAVQPDSVVVELCRSRQAVMYPAAAAGAPGQGQPGGGTSGGGGGGGEAAVLQSVGGGSESEGEEHGLAASSAINRSSSGSGSSSSQYGSTGGSGSAGSARAVNDFSLSGGGLLTAFSRSMELGGASALLLRLLLSRLSAKLAGSLGVQGGGEFVAAREEAEALEAQLVLGDRPIEITLQRAWDALTWRQRWQLAAELADGLLSVQQASLDEAAVERLKDDDAVSLLFDALSRQYPQLVGPLVHERDLYLAWSLKRSKAVNGARSVVGVVGKGHLRGVCYALTHDAAGAHLRFRDLVGGKNVKADRARQRAAAAGRFALETAALGAAWWAWTELVQAH